MGERRPGVSGAIARRAEAPDYPVGPLSLLVVQPTPFCNIDCDYCYLPQRNMRAIIQTETLERLFASVFASSILASRGFSLVWHAGEPLVLPVEFYRPANEILARHNTPALPVRVCFQTNATLISDDWCAFFAATGAQVGISLDGPQELHDRHRKTRAKAGSFNRTMAGLRRLQRAGIEFSVICVLTRESLLQPRRIFSFFAEQGITDVGFNVEELEGQHTSSSIGFEEAHRLYYRFMEEIIALREGSGIRVRELDRFGAFLKYGQPLEIAQQCTPLRIISVDHKGNLSTFSPEMLAAESPRYGRLVFGNLAANGIEDILSNQGFRAVMADVMEGVRACRRDCGYFTVCGGGAPGNKLFEHGSFAATETAYCRSQIKALTDVLLAHLG